METNSRYDNEIASLISEWLTKSKAITPELLLKNGFVNDFEESEKVNDNGDVITFQGYSYQDEGIYASYCNGHIHVVNDNADIDISSSGIRQLRLALKMAGSDKEIIID